MEDVTDTTFRWILISWGRPDVFYTEFTSCEGLCSVGKEAVAHRLEFREEERPIVAQIWGKRPEAYYQSAKMLCEMGFDGIDLNMGCPVPKIVKGGACAGLIEDKALAKEVFLAAREGAGSLPLGVKTRIGFRKVETEDWIGFLLELDPEVIVVHGRTAKQLYRVPTDWDEIGKAVALKQSMGKDTLMIGNGDVQSRLEIEEKSARFGVDGVMVGRAIFHNPFLFNASLGAVHFKDVPMQQKLDCLMQHLSLFRERWGERRDLGMMKKFFRVYASNFEGASELRAKLMEARSFEEVEREVLQWKMGQR